MSNPDSTTSLISRQKQLANHFDNRSQTFDTTSWASNEGLFGAVEAMIDFPATKCILDAGGGTGSLALHLQQHHPKIRVINLDISLAMARMSHLKRIQSAVADLLHLPIKARSLDVVIVRQVLQYTDSPHEALVECYRVLRDGGQLIIGQFVPYDTADQTWLKGILQEWQPLKKHLPTSDELMATVEDAAFRIVAARHIEINESLIAWLDRYRVPEQKRSAAFATAREHMSFLGKRQVVEKDGDFVFSNPFVVIAATK